MKKSVVVLCVLLSILGIVGISNAKLWDRGGGLIYDDVLKITWLQDAYYAGPKASYAEAVVWAENLSYYDSVRNVTWTDWRLPHTLPVNGSSYNGDYSFDGSTDYGYNISALESVYPESVASEMAYMYYINLGNTGAYDIYGKLQPDYGPSNTGPFINLDSHDYWSGTANPDYPGGKGAWYFYFGYGLQVGDGAATTSPTAWAVRDGDVEPPITITLDIKPGVFPNTIICGSKGLVPVAILTTPDFEASTVDPVTVTFDGTTVATKSRMIDVDHDGDKDLLLYFNTQDLNLNKDSTRATLTGTTDDGIDIVGTDSVTIVTKGKK